ncbi:MAG: extracellular solute-binding protein [Thermomicrobiales bacterium]|nr:extracellular solute-binding protein [Thermomicrobiales bacterium]MCO5221941.1 extracellular solute-binding protein [Thermomicrobiales bacterium]
MNRRSLLAGGSAALAGAVLAGSGGSLAQGLTGTITIGYEGTNAFIGPYIGAAAQAVMTANPGATIEVNPSISPNYLSQLALQLFTGTAPDVFLIFGLGAGELAAGGFVSSLDDYVANWDGWAQYDAATRAGVTSQGHPWAIPWGLNPYFLYYRKDLFQQAGLDPEWQPETREEIIEAAAAIQQSSPDSIPYSIYAGANGENATAADFMNLILSNGGTLIDPDGRWFIDSCPIRETLAYYEYAFQTTKVVPSIVLTDVSPLETMPNYFANGELGILHETAKHYGVWMARNAVDAETIGVALFPGNEGPLALGDVGDAWYINSGAANPDLGWAFIEAFSTVELQAALSAEDPHLPARLDARDASDWLEQPLSDRILEASTVMTLPPPEPQFRKLISVVQNATGLVAAGQATPIEAIQRYGEELTRTMGEQNVTTEACG